MTTRIIIEVDGIKIGAVTLDPESLRSPHYPPASENEAPAGILKVAAKLGAISAGPAQMGATFDSPAAALGIGRLAGLKDLEAMDGGGAPGHPADAKRGKPVQVKKRKRAK